DVIEIHDRIERAAITDVTELNVFDVVGCSADLCCDFCHIVRWNVDEFGVRFDKAADEPRTGNAIDLGMLARYPLVLGLVMLAARWQSHFLPSADATLEIDRVRTGSTQHFGHTLTDLASMIAIGDDWPAGGKFLSPALHLFRGSTQGADDQSIVVAECILPANIH